MAKTAGIFEQHRPELFRLAYGNLLQMGNLLAEETILYSDGGGKITAARKPVEGAKKTAKFLAGIQKGVPASANWWTEYREVNGEPGMIIWLEGELYNIWSFHVEDGKIRSIYVVLNPEKLEHLKRSVQSDIMNEKKAFNNEK